METGPSRRGIGLLVLYLPAGAVLIGLLANVMGLPVPKTGKWGFLDVFGAYALRFPGDFSAARWIAPALGLVILVLMLTAVRSRKTIITLFEIRMILLILIVLITLLAKILLTVIPIEPALSSNPLPYSSKYATFLLFLFVDVDLILVFFATFLPIFKPLKRRLT